VNLMARRCAKLATMAIRTRLSAASLQRPDGGRRFGLLLAVLVGTYLLSAFVPGTVIKVLQIALFLAVVMIAVRASHITQRITRLVNAVVLAGSAAAFVLQATSDTPSSPAAGVASAWIALMLLFAVILILRDVLTGKAVTLQSIFGALSAYLIIGLMFAASYAAMSKFNGGSFFANGQPGTTATFQYFSFTTLTTVGYGDFTAAAAGGRAVAVMEAILGQVYLAVLVGWLVSVFRAPRFSGDSGDSAGTAPQAPEPARRNRAAMSAAVRRSTRDRPARARPGGPARLTRRG
jgi:Ion channel